MFLLILDGDVNSVPIGLFDTSEEAVAAAAEIGFPENPWKTEGDRLDRTLQHTGIWSTDNTTIKGYQVVKFEDSEAVENRMIQPYFNEPKMPVIDPDQELDWS